MPRRRRSCCDAAASSPMMRRPLCCAMGSSGMPRRSIWRPWPGASGARLLCAMRRWPTPSSAGGRSFSEPARRSSRRPGSSPHPLPLALSVGVPRRCARRWRRRTRTRDPHRCRFAGLGRWVEEPPGLRFRVLPLLRAWARETFSPAGLESEVAALAAHLVEIGDPVRGVRCRGGGGGSRPARVPRRRPRRAPGGAGSGAPSSRARCPSR